MRTQACELCWEHGCVGFAGNYECVRLFRNRRPSLVISVSPGRVQQLISGHRNDFKRRWLMFRSNPCAPRQSSMSQTGTRARTVLTGASGKVTVPTAAVQPATLSDGQLPFFAATLSGEAAEDPEINLRIISLCRSFRRSRQN